MFYICFGEDIFVAKKTATRAKLVFGGHLSKKDGKDPRSSHTPMLPIMQKEQEVRISRWLGIPCFKHHLHSKCIAFLNAPLQLLYHVTGRFL